mmetsp:Transcript_17597/g.38106  ORF Transcript_17597/g.38106 Transcript_17597/m.38106 type:complete len:550 (+) Transcript_17597:129-1778(+)
MTMNLGQREFHIAPMIDVSTVEFRYFVRLLTKRAVIWSQMVVAETLVHRSRIRRRKHLKESNDESSREKRSPSPGGTGEGDGGVELTDDLIKYCGWWDGDGVGGVEDDVSPHPTVCQIGSNDPAEAAFATRVARGCGYDGVDLNCECPSDRVAGRSFGAALMKDGDSAAEIVSSMVRTASRSPAGGAKLPVSVKTRIGVDESDSFEFIENFIRRLVDAGCEQFVIHARKVYTQGLSPAQNRDIPPLDYPRVFRLMKKFPHCSFLMNGGIMSLDHARQIAFGSATKFDECGRGKNESIPLNEAGDDHIAVPCERCNLPHGSCLHPPNTAPPNLRGVMVGRLARDRPADLADVDRSFYGEASNPCNTRRELMNKYISFLERVYPRRCCDDDQTITLGMAKEMQTRIILKRPCCSICREFRGNSGEGADVAPIETAPNEKSLEVQPLATANGGNPPRKQGGKRSRRHAKYDGAKIVTRIIDKALQPTWGILAGEPGQKAFRRVSHELSRDKTARNCGPGYILFRAMKSVSDDVWDKPFESSGEKETTYYPTK